MMPDNRTIIDNAEIISTAKGIADQLYYDAQVKEVMVRDPIRFKNLVQKYEMLTRSDLRAFHSRLQGR